MDRQGESLCLGANEEEASGNPSGLAATILRAAFRSRIYVSNRETYPALNKALQKGGVHIRPHMTVPSGALFLGDVFIPKVGFFCDKAAHESDAIGIIGEDDFDPVFA